jgi:hypothetical protein
MAEYDRRQDEWHHQANLAAIELKQIDQQLTAAQIRLAVAEQELRNHDQQTDNAREFDQFLHSKFTNHELYQHMVGQVSGLYFQSSPTCVRHRKAGGALLPLRTRATGRPLRAIRILG